MYTKIVGGGVLIFGDLHYSGRATVGRHKNYLTNCCGVLRQIANIVETRQPKAVVLLGDLVGTVERLVKDREVLSILCKFFMEIGKIATVFCVRGNHDSGEYPEFQFLSDLGLFQTASSCDGFFDFYGSEEQIVPEVRFHLVDYGCERKELNLTSEETTNVVLAHNNFTISGFTNWYNSKDGIELSTLSNFNGVYMVISGHIHNPSPEMYSTQITGGGVCGLFYVGSPTRPAEQYESCWYADFSYSSDTQSTNYDAREMRLTPVSETFYSEDEYIDSAMIEDGMDAERKGALKDVLDEIITYRIGSDDLISQVRNIPNATEDAKDVACHYLQIALDGSR